jgi:hypothetical protein
MIVKESSDLDIVRMVFLKNDVFTTSQIINEIHKRYGWNNSLHHLKECISIQSAIGTLARKREIVKVMPGISRTIPWRATEKLFKMVCTEKACIRIEKKHPWEIPFKNENEYE